MQKTQIRSLGQEDALKKEMATHSSILAWEIPTKEKPYVLQSMGSQRVGHELVTEQQYLSTRTVIRDKEGNYILIQQEDITILNVNNSVLHILLKLTANIQQNHFLGHKAHFNKFKRIETLTVLFSPWGPSVQWLQIAVSLVVYATCCLYRLP